MGEVGSSLKGPYDAGELSKLVESDCWVAARRFPVVQKGKTRPIDDFSEHMVKTPL